MEPTMAVVIACLAALVLSVLIANWRASRAYRRKIHGLWETLIAAVGDPATRGQDAAIPVGAQDVIDKAGQAGVPFTSVTVVTGQRTWQTLGRPPFSPDMLTGLPPLAELYLRHAIADGTPLARAALLQMTGALRAQTGEWMGLVAEEIVVPGRGFVWRATARVRGLPVSGADYYVDGEGEVWFGLLGLLTVAKSAGEATRRSALGRLVGESIWCPSALLLMPGVTWEQTGQDALRLLVPAGGRANRLDLVVDARGAVCEAIVDRYDDSGRCPDREYVPFGVLVEQEQTFDGHTIPTRVHGGWLYGDEGYEETFRFEITRATFL